MSSMFAATAEKFQGLPKQPSPPSFRRSAKTVSGRDVQCWQLVIFYNINGQKQ
jgi:hypothetical protein